MENSNYCPLIFHGIYTERYANGKLAVSPCSVSKKSKPSTDPIDFVNDTHLTSIREENKRNQRSVSCQSCWDLEDHGGESKRTVILDWYKDNNLELDYSYKLYNVDYNTLPICNARCVICSPRYSSAWAASLGDNSLSEIVTHDYNHLNMLDFNNVKKIYFNGGEPLMTNEHVTVLEKINNRQVVDVSYNTNGSFYPRDTVIELWNSVKSVTLFFSIDGIGSRFEQTRKLLKWNEVSVNIEKMNALDNVDVHCTYTIGKHNVYDLEDTVNWFANLSGFDTFEKFHVHYVSPDHPLYFDTASADEKHKFKQELLKFKNFHWYNSIINSIGS
jgi:MoaA/NifB/PqqE/SkfB family radical SAM enzyme